MVFVDYNLMKAAPAYLLRGGIGDVFSCHTGRWDWEYAVKRGHDPAWDDFAAAESLRFIKELRDLAPALHKGENDAIRKLMELHRIIGKYCDDYGHSRFEEGSEHFFAYTFEHVTGRTLMHGELVALGVLIMSTLQGNKPELAREIVQAAGVRHRPEELSYTMDEIERTLLELPAFVKREKLWYSIANDLYDRRTGTEDGAGGVRLLTVGRGDWRLRCANLNRRFAHLRNLSAGDLELETYVPILWVYRAAHDRFGSEVTVSSSCSPVLRRLRLQ